MLSRVARSLRRGGARTRYRRRAFPRLSAFSSSTRTIRAPLMWSEDSGFFLLHGFRRPPLPWLTYVSPRSHPPTCPSLRWPWMALEAIECDRTETPVWPRAQTWFCCTVDLTLGGARKQSAPFDLQLAFSPLVPTTTTQLCPISQQWMRQLPAPGTCHSAQEGVASCR